jgi:hypothetical protein
MSFIISFVYFYLIIMCSDFSWLNHMIRNIWSNLYSRIRNSMDINTRCNIGYTGSRSNWLIYLLWLYPNICSRSWGKLLLNYRLILCYRNRRELMFMRSRKNLWRCSYSSQRSSLNTNWSCYRCYRRCNSSDRVCYSCYRRGNINRLYFRLDICWNFILSLRHILIWSFFIYLIIQWLDWLTWHLNLRLIILISWFSFNFNIFIFIFIGCILLSFFLKLNILIL